MESARSTVSMALAHAATAELVRQANVPGLDLKIEADGNIPSNRIYTILADAHQWDVGELAFSTYFMARDLGSDQIALPIFPSRTFPHLGVFVHEQSGIRRPVDLVEKRVGCNSFGTNYSVWLRGILAHQYDVPVQRITWVQTLGEHRPDYQPPDRFTIELAQSGERSEALLSRGELDAATFAGATQAPRSQDVRPLFADGHAEVRANVERFGFIPINTVLTVRRRTLDRQPDLPHRLLEALSEARARQDDGEPRDEFAISRQLEQETGRQLTGFGFRANRAAMREMIVYCYEQGIIRRLFDPEELFLLTDS